MSPSLDAHVACHAALSSRAWKAHRARLYTVAEKQLSQRVSPEELDVHFAMMPGRYWQQTDRAALVWHLETIHQFFAAVADPEDPGVAPVVRWRPAPAHGVTELAVCTWDRQGLLAKVTTVLAALELPIVQADIYTRADNVVLDIFQVTGTGPRRWPTTAQLEAVASRLAELLRAA